MIVLLATQVVSDVEYIVKDIIMMQRGTIVKKGTPQQLIEEMQHKVFEVLVTEEEQREYEKMEVRIANMMFTADKICLRIVAEEKPQIGVVEEVRPNLEDVYLYLVG